MKRHLAVVAALAALSATSAETPLERIAFGSCSRQDLPQPLWKPILAWHPQAWIWLGDNIYGDTEDMAVMAGKWARQKAQPDYSELRKAARILGTWDDHDYGANDAGRNYPKRAETQKLLLDFLDEPAASPRRTREGVHDSVLLGPPGRQVCVILLDVRYFRDEPQTNGDILGDAQWTWLENVLKTSPADVLVICSGTQILPQDHPYEKWADYPRSRARLLKLLEGRKGVVLLSGDRHFGEISRLGSITEVTASGMTHSFQNLKGEKNALRAGEPFAGLHFGTLEIDWTARLLKLAIRDATGKAVRTASAAF